MSLREDFGHQLRHQRTIAKLTQAELAGAINKSVEMVNRMERGLTAPSFDTIEALTEALGISAWELFGGYTLGLLGTKGKADGIKDIMALLAPMDREQLGWVRDLIALSLKAKGKGV